LIDRYSRFPESRLALDDKSFFGHYTRSEVEWFSLTNGKIIKVLRKWYSNCYWKGQRMVVARSGQNYFGVIDEDKGCRGHLEELIVKDRALVKYYGLIGDGTISICD
jgi:hypothetical protein